MSKENPVWAWLGSLAHSKDETERRRVWLQLCKGDELIAACRVAIQEQNQSVLAQAWEHVCYPDTLRYLQYFLNTERGYHGLGLVANQASRPLLGLVSTALAVEAIVGGNLQRMRDWAQVASAAWGARMSQLDPVRAVPTHRPSSGFIGMGRELRSEIDDSPGQTLDAFFKELHRSEPERWRVAAARDVAHTLLHGVPRPAARARQVPILGYRAPVGFVAWLHLELVEDGTRAFYPDPIRTAFFPMTTGFLDAIRDSFKTARRLLGRPRNWSPGELGPPDPPKPAHMDVRWWIEGEHLSVLDGASMGAALAVAFTQLLLNDPLDSRCAITAMVDNKGKLHPVAHTTDKVRAALAYHDAQGRTINRILVHPRNLTEAQAPVATFRSVTLANSRSRQPSVRCFTGDGVSVPVPVDSTVQPVSTLQEACEQSSGLPVGLCQYLRSLMNQMDTRPAQLGKRGQRVASRSPVPTPPLAPFLPLTELYIWPDLFERPRRSDSLAKRAKEETPAWRPYPPRDGQMHRLSTEETPFVDDLSSHELTDHENGDTGKRISWQTVWEHMQSTVGARAVILGGSGQGKSVLLSMLARELAREAHETLNGQQGTSRAAGEDPERSFNHIPLPVLVPMPVLTQWVPREGEDPDTVLRQALQFALRYAGVPEVIADYLTRHAHESRVWLLFDALDEAPENGPLYRSLFTALKGWECRVILTSQPHGYEARSILGEANHYDLAPFSTQQVRQFVKKWFPGSGEPEATHLDTTEQARMLHLLGGGSSLQQASQNPFLLTLLCWLSQGQPLTPNVTRTHLYDRMLRHFLRDRTDVWIPALGEVALSWFRHHTGNRPIPADYLYAVLQDSQLLPEPRRSAGSPTSSIGPSTKRERVRLLLEELQQARLLLPQSEDGARYAFPHTSILEYLAACALATQLNRPRLKLIGTPTWVDQRLRTDALHLVGQLASEPAWKQVILFLVGKLHDPYPLLEQLAQEPQDDIFRHRLGLAGLALAEIDPPSRPQEQACVNFITTEILALWLHHARMGTTRAVRHLACVLPVLGQVNGQVFLRRLEKLVDNQPGQTRGPRTDTPFQVASVREQQSFLSFLAHLLHAPESTRNLAVQTIGYLGSVATEEMRDILTSQQNMETEENRQRIARTLQALDNESECGRCGMRNASNAECGRRSSQCGMEEAFGSVPFASLSASRGNQDDPEERRCLGRPGTHTEQGQKQRVQSTEQHLEGVEGVVDGLAECFEQAGSPGGGVPGKIPRLTKLLREEDWARKLEGIHEAEQLGARCPPLILTRLAELMESQGDEVRYAVAKAVAVVGPTAATPAILKQLARLLASRDWSLRYAGTLAVGALGASAMTPMIVDCLTRQLGDRDEHSLRYLAAAALESIHPKDVTDSLVEELTARLKDRHLVVRAAAAMTCRQLTTRGTRWRMTGGGIRRWMVQV